MATAVSMDPDAVRNRLLVFAAMAAMLVVALAVPQAFGEDAWLFAIAYAVVRLTHIARPATASAVRRLAVSPTLGPR